jgi:biotin/methionine sulfoxide reductase
LTESDAGRGQTGRVKRPLDLAARELDRVRSDHGNEAIYGGSYGWAAQGLMDLRLRPVSWAHIAEHTDLLVSFGGLRRSNSWVVPGGHNRHVGSGLVRRAGASTRIVFLSAQSDDVSSQVDSEWIGVMPGTDTAVILALIHVLVTDGLADDAFLERYTVGAEQVRRYVLGQTDGIPKTPEWAQGISRVPAGRIRALAHEMAASRTLVNVVYSVQRAQYGEQPVSAALTLAAFLGQIGLPGGGFSHGFGSMGDYGVGYVPVRTPLFPQDQNPISTFIPCARISDMLLHPGEAYPYDGGIHRYPEIRLAYWAGGKPIPSPPEPRAPATCVRSTGHVHRQRDALDRRRKACGHRLSGRLVARA